MRDRSFVIHHRGKNQSTLKQAENTKEEIKARLFDSVQKRYDCIMEKIKKLQDKKSEFLSGPSTKEEVLEEAKRRLYSNRQTVIELFLKTHLEICKESNVAPFRGRTILPGHAEESVIWLALTEEDIERAVDMLNDTGMSDKDRKAAVEKIDAEISELMKSLENEREDAKRFQE